MRNVKDTAEGITVTRRELYELVWEKPMSQLAEEFGMSDVGLAKICKRLNVPRPGNGYWTKRKYGKAPKQPRLPRSTTPGQHEVLIRGRGEPKPDPFGVPRKLEILDALEDPHPLIAATLEVLSTQDTDNTSLSRPCLDIRVSPKNVKRACRVMDALIKYVESRGCSVAVSKCSYSRGYDTFAIINGAEIGVFIDEVKEDQPRCPTGGLSLAMYPFDLNRRSRWNDGKRQTVESLLPNFIRTLFKIAPTLKARQDERREEERARIETKRQQLLLRHEQEKAEKLLKDAQRWQQAKLLRDYIAAMDDISPKSHGLQEWIAWAREYAESCDPINYPESLPFRSG